MDVTEGDRVNPSPGAGGGGAWPNNAVEGSAEITSDGPAAEEMRTLVRPENFGVGAVDIGGSCLLYTSPSPRDLSTSRMPSSA